MTDAPASTPAPTYAIKRHHMHWGLLGLVLLVGVIAVVAFSVGGGNVSNENGQLVVTVPRLDTFTNRVKIKTADGEVVQAQVQQPVQPAPNGKTASTTDDFGAEHRIQRTEVNTDRYDPIDKLAAVIKASNDSMNQQVKAVGQQVENLVGSVTKVSGRLDNLGTKVDGAITRIATLENKQATPAPAPTAAPTAQPAPGLQSAVPAPTKVVANVDDVNPNDVAQAAKAYRHLGPAPGGTQLQGFSVTENVNDFTCPDGSHGRKVKAVKGDGQVFTRWACPHQK